MVFKGKKHRNEDAETLIEDVTKKFGLFKNVTIWYYAPCDSFGLNELVLKLNFSKNVKREFAQIFKVMQQNG